MATRPSKPWRLVTPSTDGPIYKPQRSEAATRSAVGEEKQATTADQIIVEKWEGGRWEEWLRWIRNGDGWQAQ